jgi:hypothetical protein
MHFKDETAFNAAVRGILRSRGLKCCHVRETDTPGPLDLVVWLGRVLVCWIELKLDDEEVRPSQVEFLRQNDTCSMVLRWKNEEQIMEWHPVGVDLRWPPYKMTWQEFVQWTICWAEWATGKQSLIEE